MHFDLGQSVTFSRPVLTVVLERLPNTLLLMGSATALSFSLGSLLGIVAGSRPGSFRDRALSIGSLAIYAVPGFWLGLVLTVLFAVRLRWLPVSGIETIASGKYGLDRVVDIARHLVLPVASLGFIYLALYLRVMRAGMAEAWRQDFVLAARARGIPRRRIVTGHVARNALLPLVTMLGLQSAAMLGGSVVIESAVLNSRTRPACAGGGCGARYAAAARHHPGQRRHGDAHQPHRRHALCGARSARRRERGGSVSVSRFFHSPEALPALVILARVGNDRGPRARCSFLPIRWQSPARR